MLCEMSKFRQNSLIIDYTNGFLPNHLEKIANEVLSPKQHVVRQEPLPINPFLPQVSDNGGIVIKENSNAIAKRIAEKSNGDLEITKVEGSGGIVSECTVKEQLLYELQNPAAYITPDVVVDFTDIEIRQTAPNRVSVKGGRGKPKTGLLKVNVGYNDCFIGEGEISYGGFNAIGRARLAGETVLKRLDLCGIEYSEIRVDLIGVDSLFKQKIGAAMTSGDNAEVRLRVAGRTKDRFNADRIGYEVETLFCCGPAAGGGARRLVREIISLASILIDEKDVVTEVCYFGGNQAA